MVAVKRDWEVEEFCRLVACNVPRSRAYKEAFNSCAQTTTLWEQGSKLAAKHSARIAELRAALGPLPEQDWVAGKAERMAYLTRSMRTPIDAIADDPTNGDLVQERKVVEMPEGGKVTTIKANNRLAAVHELNVMTGDLVQAPQQLHLHQHNNLTLTGSVESLVDDLVTVNAPVVELEPVTLEYLSGESEATTTPEGWKSKSKHKTHNRAGMHPRAAEKPQGSEVEAGK